MTNHITLNLRPAENAHPETVDLDDLTPRARAFAEAIHGCYDHQPLDIEFEGPESQRRSTRNWSPLNSTSPMSAVEWLEREIRTIPLDWYPIGSKGGPRVPSWEAGAADKAITRDMVLEYMRSHGHPMDVTAWDTLRGAGHLPEPDRYVCGQPQWKLETIDAYIRRDVDLWPISRIAEYLGYSGSSATGSARKQLSRWGFTAASRAPGRGGESLYASDQITAAQNARPGRGARTDLKETAMSITYTRTTDDGVETTEAIRTGEQVREVYTVDGDVCDDSIVCDSDASAYLIRRDMELRGEGYRKS